MDKFISNSVVSADSVEIYDKARIVNSEIASHCIVGDFSRIMDSKLRGYNKIDRNTLVYFSEFGLASYIGSNSVVMHSEVGRFCSLSWGITIGPANHDYTKFTTHDFLYNKFYGVIPQDAPAIYDRFEDKTKIGNDVWIGTNSTIVNGVSIGDGAVVGANTMVTKDIPPYAIVVGNPGRVIKFRFEEAIIQELLELKWWDQPLEKIREKYEVIKTNDIQKIIKSFQ